jgi:hypothetical protein
MTLVQIPMMGLSWGSLSRANSVIGTCRATVLTLNPASVSSPASEKSAPYSRSNTLRSRKNGSSDCPANAWLVPPANTWLPCITRAL